METTTLGSGVYEILNTVDGKRYVGSAVKFRSRCKAHLQMLRLGKHHSCKLQNAWDKHGAAAFKFRPLLICEPRHAVLYEQIVIDALLPEYNICPVAGSTLGLRWTDEARELARERNTATNPFKGRSHSSATKALISAAQAGNVATKGKCRSAAAVEKSAAAHRGAKRSAETRARIAAAALGRVRSADSVEAGAAKLRGSHRDPEQIKHLLGNQHASGQVQTEERKALAAARSREMWSDPERRAAILSAQAAAREKRRTGR